MFNDAYGVAVAKSKQGHLLDGPALPQASGQAGIVHDPTTADVDTVMAVTVAHGGKMSAAGRLTSKAE
ncbi:MAG TPA: hypothetical protein VK727_10385 [Steroidobacteraceae bacterium]|nr:hypothetical protein [Steroidobacteraceae bacterium]